MSSDFPPPPPDGGGYPPPPPGGYPPGGGGGYGAPGPMPENYLVWAILTTLFCCLPAGVVSIVFASQVSGKYHSGDYAGAVRSSENAKRWAIYSAIAAAVLVVVYLVFAVALVANN